MNVQTLSEQTIPEGFDGPVHIARRNADPILNARVTQWTGHGIVVVYDTRPDPDNTLQPTRVRKFIPYEALSSVTAILSAGEEAQPHETT